LIDWPGTGKVSDIALVLSRVVPSKSIVKTNSADLQPFHQAASTKLWQEVVAASLGCSRGSSQRKLQSRTAPTRKKRE